MSSLQLDQRAAQLAAEGNTALGAGDTVRAAALFKEAAATLEAEAAATRKQADKALIRFSAATHYCNGGMYGRAEEVSRRVQARLLPQEVRTAFETFRRDLKERSAPDYRRRVRKHILRAWVGKEFAKVLEMLQDHPYVLPPDAMAFLRACCCEYLKKYRAAALFSEDLRKFNPQDITRFVTVAAAYPLALMQEDLSEAWEYVKHQLAVSRHAVPNINASLICYHQGSRATTEDERRALSGDQLRYCSTAWQLFHEMPPQHQQHRDMRGFMTLCLGASVFGWTRLGEREKALEAANQSVEFHPSYYGAWTVRGLVTYPSPEAVRDFREAIGLGEFSSAPYYHLAHWSFMGDEFTEAASWCEQALGRHPSAPIRARLLEMLAIARSYLGFDRKAIEPLFAEAEAVDPANPRIKHNRQVYRQMAAAAAPTAEPPGWDRGEIADLDGLDGVVLEQERLMLGRRQEVNRAERSLAAIGA